jgi:hypothetical protein
LITITGWATQLGRPVNGDRSGVVTDGLGDPTAEEALEELEDAAPLEETPPASPLEHAAIVALRIPMQPAKTAIRLFTSPQ